MLKVPRGHAYEATAVGGWNGGCGREMKTGVGGAGSGRERPLT